MRPLDDEIRHGLLTAALRPVEHQTHGECGLAMLAGSDGVRQFGKPIAKTTWPLPAPKAAGPAAQLAGLRIVPFVQFGGELQEPRQPIRSLKGPAPVATKIDEFGGDPR